MTTNHTEEQPLVSWGDIAAFLKVTKSTAKGVFQRNKIDCFKVGHRTAIFPSSLKEQLQKTAQSPQQRLNKEMLIYFVQAEDRGIKIGITDNIKGRLNALQNNSVLKLNLLGVIRGNIKRESKIHERFKKYKIHGEWFEVQKEILTYIKRYKDE